MVWTTQFLTSKHWHPPTELSSLHEAVTADNGLQTLRFVSSKAATRMKPFNLLRITSEVRCVAMGVTALGLCRKSINTEFLGTVTICLRPKFYIGYLFKTLRYLSQ